MAKSFRLILLHILLDLESRRLVLQLQFQLLKQQILKLLAKNFHQNLLLALVEKLNYLRQKMSIWRTLYPGVESLNVAVMGCVVNGPGESKLADIGISLPGTGETPVAPVYVDGERKITLKGDNIATEFLAIVEEYVKTNYGENSSKRNKGKVIPIQSL